MTSSPLKRGVFLDRDGTINKEVSYLSKIEDLRLLPGAAKAILLLNKAGFKVVVVTNQSGIARGYFDKAFVDKVHKEIGKRLASKGAWIDRWYFCPHHPDVGAPEFRKNCTCRKPNTGLIDQAAKEVNIQLLTSFMVGDSLRDMEAGWKAGLRTVLVLTGYGKETLEGMNKRQRKKLDFVARNLLEASRWIVEQH